MPATLLLRQVNLLEGPGLPARASDVLVEGNRLVSLDLHRNSKTEADQSDRQPGKEAWLEIDASQLWLGPALVDPHSVLDDPHLGRAETLHAECRFLRRFRWSPRSPSEVWQPPSSVSWRGQEQCWDPSIQSSFDLLPG